MFAHPHFKNAALSLMISFALLRLLLASAASMSSAARAFYPEFTPDNIVE